MTLEATPAVAARLSEYPLDLRWTGELLDEYHGRPSRR